MEKKNKIKRKHTTTRRIIVKCVRDQRRKSTRSRSINQSIPQSVAYSISQSTFIALLKNIASFLFLALKL